MASLQATADSVRAALCSTSTCTPATCTTLSDLLLPKANASEVGNHKSITKGAPVARGRSGKAAPAKGKTVVFADENKHGEGKQLSAKERSILATEVINATLKALSEAIKAPPPRKKDSSKDLVKASARKVLRRSNSMPQSPLQPKSLNRVSSSPDISSRYNSSPSSSSIPSSGYRSSAECARVAFACLRTLQAGKVPGVDLPHLQLENGMSVLVGKLVTLKLDDLAVKELRILKRRLDPRDSKLKRAGNAATAPQTLDELLDFGKGEFSEAKLGLIITTQLQVLRLLASSRKPRLVESALLILKTSHPSSPTNLLLSAAKSSIKPDKFARQLQALSEILLSLGPSISISDDATALEPRLSVTPEAAFQLQILALHNRSLWWQLAGHNGDTSKELLDPFLRCLSAFARRGQNDTRETYKLSLELFDNLQSLVRDLGETEPWPKSLLKRIYKIFSNLALGANHLEHAIDWMKKIKGLVDLKADSEVKRTCVEARLISLTLRRSSRQPEDEELLLALLEGLERPFKGESSEIDDLMTEVSSARRVAVTVLADRCSSRGGDFPEGMREMCESLVLLCPRLILRYLGNPPSTDSAAKDIVRHEQRRHFITKPGHNAVDSVLFLVRTFLAEGNLTWDLMDSKLQDCLLLLDRLDSSAGGTASNPPAAASYYVKISNLYHSQYLNMRRDCSSSQDGQLIRALRRSIDCVRNRSRQEKKSALFATKLERIAELYRDVGRYDELFRTLLDVRDEMIENGALLAVTAAAAVMRFQAAWINTEEISTFARTVRSLLKVHFRYLEFAEQTTLLKGDWTTDERATILEQYLDILCSQSDSIAAAVIFRGKVFEALLAIYNRREYPLRRLRVLTRLLLLDVDSRKEIVDNMGAELDALRIDDMDIGNSKDVGLQEFLVYRVTLATSILELQKEQPSIDTLKRNLLVWSSIRRGSESLEALQRQVEDIPGLLAHLQSVAAYMQLMGFELMRLATLKLVAEYSELFDDSPDDLVYSFSNLGSQWLHLGYSGKAGLALDKAQFYSHQDGISTTGLLQLHLSYAQYLLEIGNYDKCEEQLLRAHAIYTANVESEFRSTSTAERRAAEKQLVSNAYLVQSKLALERGAPQTALMYAKQSLRFLRRAWMNLQEQQNKKSSQPGNPSLQLETEKLSDDTANLSLSIIKSLRTDEQQWMSGSAFWPLITPLFRAMSHLSTLHAHHGMFQETVYYAEQALKLVQEVRAEGHTAIASAHLGGVLLNAGNLDKGSELLMAAKRHCASGDQTRESALLAYNLGKLHGILGDHDAEMETYEDAETTLHILTESNFINKMDCLESSMAALAISETKPVARRQVVARPKRGAPKTGVKKSTIIRAKTPVESVPSIAEECPQLFALKAKVLRQKAQIYTSTRKFADALALLSEAEGYSNTQTATIEQGLALAKQFLLQSIEKMHGDPVYSVLQESTISFPSIASNLKLDRHSGDRLSIARTSPQRKLPATKGRRDINRARSLAPDNFFDKLRRAQEHLTEVHSAALTVAPLSLVHTISALLNSVAILLSASGPVKGKPLAHPGLASCSIGMFSTSE